MTEGNGKNKVAAAYRFSSVLLLVFFNSAQLLFADLRPDLNALCGNSFAAIAGDARGLGPEFEREPGRLPVNSVRFERSRPRPSSEINRIPDVEIMREPTRLPAIESRMELDNTRIPELDTRGEVPELQPAVGENRITRRSAPVEFPVEIEVTENKPVPELKPRYQRLSRRPNTQIEAAAIERRKIEIDETEVQPILGRGMNRIEIEEVRPEIVLAQVETRIDRKPAPVRIVEGEEIQVATAAKKSALFVRLNRKQVGRDSEREAEGIEITRVEGDTEKLQATPSVSEKTTPDVKSATEAKSKRTSVAGGSILGGVRSPIRVSSLLTEGINPTSFRGTSQGGEGAKAVERVGSARGDAGVDALARGNEFQRTQEVPSVQQQQPQLASVPEAQVGLAKTPARTPQVIDEGDLASVSKPKPGGEIIDPSRTFSGPTQSFPTFFNPSFPNPFFARTTPSKTKPNRPSVTGNNNAGGFKSTSPSIQSTVKPGSQITPDGEQNRIGSSQNTPKASENRAQIQSAVSPQLKLDPFEMGDGLSMLKNNPIVEPGELAEQKSSVAGFSNPRGPKTKAAKPTSLKVSNGPKKAAVKIPTEVASAKNQSTTPVSSEVKVLPRIVPQSPFASPTASSVASLVAQASTNSALVQTARPRPSALRNGGLGASASYGTPAGKRRPRFTDNGKAVGNDGAETARRTGASNEAQDSSPSNGAVVFYDTLGSRTKQVQTSFRLQPNRVDIVTETLFDPLTKLPVQKTIVETESILPSGNVRESTTVIILDPVSGKSVSQTQTTTVKNKIGMTLSFNVEITRFDPKLGVVTRTTKSRLPKRTHSMVPMLASP